MQDWCWVLRGADLIKFKWKLTEKQGPTGQRERENENL